MITMLCIRDPDHENEYVADAPMRTIDIDIGGQWRDYKEFCWSLANGDLGALEFEAHVLSEVADLDADNPVRVRVADYFATARQMGA